MLQAGSHRREAPRPGLSRAQPLGERAPQMAQGLRGKRRRGFYQKQPSANEALEARIAELERFCGQLSLENQILKKSLKRCSRQEAHRDRAGA